MAANTTLNRYCALDDINEEVPLPLNVWKNGEKEKL